ncbi:hypothetical protein RA307_18565 [Xanthobacteraceae bacterium Astr-EGSB]|uniref:hypothetical protein n=1 Tax=Astrobacterium formosum TaxID=3069710 RepID=UPI0027B6C8E3|nr:hypothetical protein [Xanthobacteraceae bacterium Astr-EGSB]
MRRRAHTLAMVAIALVVFAVRSAFLIRDSLVDGRLSIPTTDDDVAYFYDALDRLRTFASEGGGQFTLELWRSPPHSPLGTGIGMIAFAAGTPDHAAVFVVNALLVAAILAWVVVPYIHRVTDAALPLMTITLIPFIDELVTVGRPDFMAGLIAGFSCLLILRTNFAEAKYRHMLLLGIVAAVALLSKPTAFLPIGLLVFSAGVLSYLNSLGPGKLWDRKALICLGVAVSTCLALILPYALAQGKFLLWYMNFALFQHQDVSGYDGTLVSHLLYYPQQLVQLFGAGGMALLCLVPLALWTARRSGNPVQYRVFLAMILLVVLAYAISTGIKVKTYYLGANFIGFILVLTAAALAYLVGHMSRVRSHATTAVLVFTAIFVVASYRSVQLKYSDDFRNDFMAVFHAGEREVNVIETQGRRPRLYFVHTWPLNGSVLIFDCALRGKVEPLAGPDGLIGYYRSQAADYLKEMSEYDVVFVPETKLVMSVGLRLPVEPALADIKAWLDRSDVFELSETLQLSKGRFYVYRNLREFHAKAY